MVTYIMGFSGVPNDVSLAEGWNKWTVLLNSQYILANLGVLYSAVQFTLPADHLLLSLGCSNMSTSLAKGSTGIRGSEPFYKQGGKNKD